MSTFSSGLASFRNFFNDQHILICFNGPISRSLIVEIGAAIKGHIEATQICESAAMDVFSVYIEMSQNIRHYALSKSFNDKEASATVIIAETEPGRYAVSAGNLVELADGKELLSRIDYLAQQDKPNLKLLYKQQLRKPRLDDQVTGAGLGLIEIARKSSQPLEANLSEPADGKAFFSLRAII